MFEYRTDGHLRLRAKPRRKRKVEPRLLSFVWKRERHRWLLSQRERFKMSASSGTFGLLKYSGTAGRRRGTLYTFLELLLKPE